MEPLSNTCKEEAALARRKRKQILQDRRLKKLRNSKNDVIGSEGSHTYYAPSRSNIRTPLSDIAYAFNNSNNTISHSNNKNYASVTPNLFAAAARSRRKHILQGKMPRYNIPDENLSNNSPGCFRINTPSISPFETPLSNITAYSPIARNMNIRPQPCSSVYKSKIQLNVGTLQSMTRNLFNHFANANDISASSSTTNRAMSFDRAINFTPDVNINNDNSGEDTSTDDSLTDNSCEFNVAEGNYDSSSSLDDEEVCDSTSTSIDSSIIDYSDIGDPDFECTHCGALMWYQEKTKKADKSIVPNFQLCFGKGKVVLPLLKTPPLLLQRLLFDNTERESRNYQQFCRLYNMMFAFTSSGMKIDNRFQGGKGPPNLRIHGQCSHRIGSMLPLPGHSPKFAQLYIYDTDNEIQNRIEGIGSNPNIITDTVNKLKLMLDEFNTHAKSFRMAADRIKNCPLPDLKLKLISDRSTDGRIYNHPTVSEVAALIVGDVDTGHKKGYSS